MNALSPRRWLILGAGAGALLAALVLVKMASAAEGQYVYPYYNECSTVGRGYAYNQGGFDSIYTWHQDDMSCAVTVAARSWGYNAGWHYSNWGYDGTYADAEYTLSDLTYTKGEVKLLVGTWSPSVFTGLLYP